MPTTHNSILLSRRACIRFGTVQYQPTKSLWPPQSERVGSRNPSTTQESYKKNMQLLIKTPSNIHEARKVHPNGGPKKQTSAPVIPRQSAKWQYSAQCVNYTTTALTQELWIRATRWRHAAPPSNLPPCHISGKLAALHRHSTRWKHQSSRRPSALCAAIVQASTQWRGPNRLLVDPSHREVRGTHQQQQ